MTTVTLDEIKAMHQQLAKMIAQFESATKLIEDLFPINVSFPQLKDGEKWLGLVMSADGSKKEHIILLPGEVEDVKWQEAMDWAASIGGELPDRVEQALLFKSLKSEFKEEAYWSCETHADNTGWAWYQYFNYGYQIIGHKDDKLRARAVRRVLVI